MWRISDWKLAYALRPFGLAISTSCKGGIKVAAGTFPVILETFDAGGQSRRAPNVRLIAGQGLPVDMRVDCCTQMRNSQPVGSIFEVELKLVPRQHGFALYAPRFAKFEVLSKGEAAKRISERGPVES